MLVVSYNGVTTMSRSEYIANRELSTAIRNARAPVMPGPRRIVNPPRPTGIAAWFRELTRTMLLVGA